MNTADFVSPFWSWYITLLTLASIVALFIVNYLNTEAPKKPGAAEPMPHKWDETLQELNNPLPKWWLNLFYVTLVFSSIYLVLYPGLGTFAGVLGWSERGQYEAEQKAAADKYGPLYEGYAAQDLAALAANPDAMKTGERLFANYCATCHGSDARGSASFPNLTDTHWRWGGAPDQIEATIQGGRQGAMPAKGGNMALTDADVKALAQYVISLGGGAADATMAAAGQTAFATVCVACHGADGKGNAMLGAPDLTQHAAFIYGSSVEAIEETIGKGRSGKMPAFKDFLGPQKTHLLAAYVQSLSAKQ